MKKIEFLSKIYQKEGTHLRELSRALKLGMPTVEHHLKSLERDNLIRKVREGKTVKLFLNYKNTSIIPYLYMAEYSRLSTLPDSVKAALFDLLGQLAHKPLLTAVFGSYAKGTSTKESDLDLFLVFDKPEKGDIENKSKLVRYRHGVEIAPVYMAFREFSQKFFDGKDKFMRELRQNKIIVQGVEWWVLLENEK